MQPGTRLGHYEILSPLGKGGMGEVYRAYDRLTDAEVALKAVQVGTGAPRASVSDPPSPRRTAEATTASAPASTWTDEKRLALAQEFSVLASLRHPNIIRVLDYGFGPSREPFFTMALLSDAVDVRQAALSRDMAGRIALLVDILHALAYLHRRGILHCDLKPSNVLVAGGQVKLLDFGLATVHATARIAGSIPYMAPEVLSGSSTSVQSDLYGIGVIAYEMLASRHPFAGAVGGGLVARIRNKRPEPLESHPKIAHIVDRLLSKDPSERHADAGELIADLCVATNRAPPPQTAALAESYIRSAVFVGRRKELEMLQGALEAALDRAGSVWAVAGESGVGKSRLLHELRVRALVEGAIVLQGEAVRDGASLYQLLRRPTLTLLLYAPLSGADAAVLRAIYCDIARILPSDSVSDPASMDPQAFGERFAEILERLLRGARAPVVLLLEDCQWAVESLRVVAALARVVRTLPLLIVMSFRDDERRDLPDACPGTKLLKLERFDRAEIGELSAAILGGKLGGNDLVVDFLERETEGNAFFLVECIHELAERAGGLDRVRSETLPRRVFPIGIKDAARRRLQRVPASLLQVLQLAAVSGRRPDRRLLDRTSDPEVVERCLIAATNAAILEGDGSQFRFVHEKLREGLLDDLDVGTRRELNRRVALAIEDVYGTDDPERHAALAVHWRAAGDIAKAVRYSQLAAGQLLSQGSPERAVRLAVDAARMLGVDIPEVPDFIGEAIGREMVRIARLLAERKDADLKTLPVLQDERVKNVIRTLRLVAPAAHISAQFQLFELCILNTFALTLEYGRGPDASFVVATYAAVCRRTDTRLASALSQTAMEMDLAGASRQVSSAVLFLHTWFINHWVNPVRSSIEPARCGARVGFAEGDITYGCFNSAAAVIYMAVAGAPLAEVVAAAETQYQAIGETVRVAAFHCILERQFALALAGRTRGQLSLTDDAHDHERDIASITRTTNVNQMGFYHTAIARLKYYYGDYAGALEESEKALDYAPAFQGQVVEIELAFFRALALLAGSGGVPTADREEAIQVAERLHRTFQRWTGECEANFRHKQTLIAAELSRVRGMEDRAGVEYIQAAASAAEHGFMQHEALAYERAADFHAELGAHQKAREFGAKAVRTYRRWGAHAKAAWLGRRAPYFD